MRSQWRLTPGLLTLACVTASATACSDSTPTVSNPGMLAAALPAKAFGIWVPGRTDTCSPEIHNQYATVGPDGKKYPTWHPPVDPVTGCTFGHEHGRDPHGSALYPTVGDLPFGYANEQLDAAGLGMQRHEDHVGHKVEWENDIRIQVAGGAGAAIEVRCDVLVKLHQGTHSKDAFTKFGRSTAIGSRFSIPTFRYFAPAVITIQPQPELSEGRWLFALLPSMTAEHVAVNAMV